MIDQEEINSLIPLEPEELDHPMGATQSTEDDDDDNTQPPSNTKESPSDLISKEIETLEQKKEYLKSLRKPIINSIEGNSAYSEYEKTHRIEEFKKEHEKEINDIDEQIVEVRKKAKEKGVILHAQKKSSFSK